MLLYISNLDLDILHGYGLRNNTNKSKQVSYDLNIEPFNDGDCDSFDNKIDIVRLSDFSQTAGH